MKISQISRTLQVPVPTLRRWTREFADGLSPSARGAGSADRLFQLDDLTFLRRVKMTMSKEDITYDEARRQLGIAADLQDSPSGSGHGLGPPSEEERQKVVRYVRAIVEEVVEADIERLERLEAQVAEQGRQLAQMRALIEDLAGDSPKDGRLSRKGFPWTR